VSGDIARQAYALNPAVNNLGRELIKNKLWTDVKPVN